MFLKKLYIPLFIVFFGLQSQAQEVLTLEDAVKIALENNYEIKIAKNDLKIDFSVPEKYSSFIKKDLKVQFTMGADTTIHIARVIASEESVDMDTRNLNVRALVEGNPNLVPGSFANVKLPLDVSSSSIMVPSQSIIPQGRKKVVIVNNICYK